MTEQLEKLREPERASERLLDVITGVAAEVLETMFFAEAIPAVCSHDWLKSAVSGFIAFHGSHSGELRLCVSLAAADSIACAFLGVEPSELTEPLRTQVMLELTNISCGAILSRLWTQATLALDPPAEVVASEPACGGALHCCFELPEGPLGLWLCWREESL